MARIIDLDALLDLDHVTVKIDGKRYKLPGDIPVPDYLALERLAKQMLGVEARDDDQTLGDVMGELCDRLLAIFQVHQPKLDALPVGPKRLLPLVFAYLNGADEDDDEGEGEPVPPTRRRASTKTKPAGSPRKTTTKKKPR